MKGRRNSQVRNTSVIMKKKAKNQVVNEEKDDNKEGMGFTKE